jgi:predicted sulfurtransferase
MLLVSSISCYTRLQVSARRVPVDIADTVTKKDMCFACETETRCDHPVNECLAVEGEYCGACHHSSIRPPQPPRPDRRTRSPRSEDTDADLDEGVADP